MCPNVSETGPSVLPAAASQAPTLNLCGGRDGTRTDDLHGVNVTMLVLDEFSCGVDVRLDPEVIGVEWSQVVAKVLRGFVSRVPDVSPAWPRYEETARRVVAVSR